MLSASLYERKDAEQRIATACPFEGATHCYFESRSCKDSCNIGYLPFLHVSVAFHSSNWRFHPVRFRSAMQTCEEESSGFQHRLKPSQGFFDVVRANVEQAKRRPQTMETRFCKFKVPHIHLMNVCLGNTFFGHIHESVGQIDGYNSEAQQRKSFGIDSRSAA